MVLHETFEIKTKTNYLKSAKYLGWAHSCEYILIVTDILVDNNRLRHQIDTTSFPQCNLIINRYGFRCGSLRIPRMRCYKTTTDFKYFRDNGV